MSEGGPRSSGGPHPRLQRLALELVARLEEARLESGPRIGSRATVKHDHTQTSSVLNKSTQSFFAIFGVWRPFLGPGAGAARKRLGVKNRS